MKMGPRKLLKRDVIVSIVIPAYNGENTIAQAVNSALQQTLKETEVVVVDDGSSDRTSNILREFGERIVLVKQENRGVAEARNTGIAHSHGIYISFLDQDDTYRPQKAAMQTRLMDLHPDHGVCYGCWLSIDQLSGRSKLHGVNANLIDRSCGPLPPYFQIGSGLFRREWLDKIGGLRPEAVPCDDTDLCFRLWAAGCRFLPCHEVVSTWTLRAGMERRIDMWQNHLEVLEMHFRSMGEDFSTDTKNRLKAQTLIKIGAIQLYHDRVDSAAEYWVKAIRIVPEVFMDLCTWRTVLAFLDPSSPLHDKTSYEDTSVNSKRIAPALLSARALNLNEEANYRTSLRPELSLMALAMSEAAMSKSRIWLSRYWLLQSFMKSPIAFVRRIGPKKLFRMVFGPNCRACLSAPWNRFKRNKASE